MRTRSSRFFVILLHLVGVSYPSWMSSEIFSSSGIVAVWPWPVALERIQDLSTLSSSLLDDEDDDQDGTPVWLQDSSDGSCLGPTGTFTDCGDATLWFVEEKKPQHQRRNRVALLAGAGSFLSSLGRRKKRADSSDDDDDKPPQTGFTFTLVDRDYEVHHHAAVRSTSAVSAETKTQLHKKKKRKPRSAECLDADPRDETVDVQRCRQRFLWQPRNSVWSIDENGVLQLAQRDGTSYCLSRNGSTASAVLADCSSTTDANNSLSLAVQFSFLRYRAVAVPDAALNKEKESILSGGSSSSSSEDHVDPAETVSVQEERAQVPLPGPSMPPQVTETHLPVNRDLAHCHASEPVVHPEPKLASTTLNLDSNRRKKSQQHPLQDVLSHTNPILIADRTTTRLPAQKNPLQDVLSHTNPILVADRTTTRLPTQKNPLQDVLSNNNPILIADRTTTSLSTQRSLMDGDRHMNMHGRIHDSFKPVKRIQTHPYINEAKNEIWTDPQTGLEYHTDLCNYLDRDRKEHGRHTITGMGIYRKGFVIKVYGVAFYVSKRDVLADNNAFAKYASLTADELRKLPDFYEMLRKMGTPETGRYFDRTIMLKTNMQLSAETMRSSLQADWSYLTDEMKETLINSSMQPRPISEEMKKIVESPDNPSRCSCSQVAPPEYEANSECCARGTELVFTWTKENKLEVRLNRVLMDTFPRPDIAEGIFYEYLRHDDPISPELRDRVVDGFPFLLGPLAQVRGVKIGQSAHQKVPHRGHAVMHAVGSFAEAAKAHGIEFAAMAKRSAHDAAENAGHAARAFGDAAIGFGRELDRKRDSLVKHTVAAPGTVMKLLSRDAETLQSLSRWISGKHLETLVPEEEEPPIEQARKLAPRGRAFGYPLSRWFGEDYHAPDEIGPMKIHPTVNRIILALVHLYLLLLFIVSFPGSYSARTKLIIRKSCQGQDISDSESDTSEDNGKACLDENVEDIRGCNGKRLKRQGNNKLSRSRRSLLSRARMALRPSL